MEVRHIMKAVRYQAISLKGVKKKCESEKNKQLETCLSPTAGSAGGKPDC